MNNFNIACLNIEASFKFHNYQGSIFIQYITIDVDNHPIKNTMKDEKNALNFEQFEMF